MNSTYQPSVEIFEVVDGKEVLVHTERIKETKFRTGAIRQLRLKCDPTAQASANRAAEKRKNAPLDCGTQLKKARIEETGSNVGAENEDAPEVEEMDELENKQQTSTRCKKEASNDTKILQKQPKKASSPENSKNKKKKNCSK